MKLKIKDVEFGYSNMPVLRNVNIELAESEILGVVGPNGAGLRDTTEWVGLWRMGGMCW